MEKKRHRDAFNALLVQKTAKKTGISERHVRRVIDGTTENKDVEVAYMTYKENMNKVLQAVDLLDLFGTGKNTELELSYRNYDN